MPEINMTRRSFLLGSAALASAAKLPATPIAPLAEAAPVVAAAQPFVPVITLPSDLGAPVSVFGTPSSFGTSYRDFRYLHYDSRTNKGSKLAWDMREQNCDPLHNENIVNRIRLLTRMELMAANNASEDDFEALLKPVREEVSRNNFDEIGHVWDSMLDEAINVIEVLKDPENRAQERAFLRNAWSDFQERLCPHQKEYYETHGKPRLLFSLYDRCEYFDFLFKEEALSFEDLYEVTGHRETGIRPRTFTCSPEVEEIFAHPLFRRQFYQRQTDSEINSWGEYRKNNKLFHQTYAPQDVEIFDAYTRTFDELRTEMAAHRYAQHYGSERVRITDHRVLLTCKTPEELRELAAHKFHTERCKWEENIRRPVCNPTETIEPTQPTRQNTTLADMQARGNSSSVGFLPAHAARLINALTHRFGASVTPDTSGTAAGAPALPAASAQLAYTPAVPVEMIRASEPAAVPAIPTPK